MRTFTTYPGRDALLRHTRVGAQFNDIPGHGGDECVLASALCKYDLRKGDLFVLSWARVR